MKAAVFKALQHPLSVESVADPVPRADEVLIRVGRCGICGTDLSITREAVFGVPEGTILGHEFAGEVVDMGSTVEGLRRGDHVAVLPLRHCGSCVACRSGRPAHCAQMEVTGGGYGEYACVAERQCLRLPTTVSVADGALVEPLAVGLHGANAGPVVPGARVLVIGAGPIGLATAFWARRLGAERVAVAGSSMALEPLAHAMGATDFVSSSELDADGEAVLGGLPDLVFEAVGKPGLIAQAIDLVKPRGTVVVLGLCTAIDRYNPFQLMMKEVRLQTSMFYDLNEFKAAAEVLTDGAVEPRSMVTETVALSALPVAFEALRQRTTQCKTLMDPWRT